MQDSSEQHGAALTAIEEISSSLSATPPALREYQILLDAILAVSPAGICIVDRTLLITSANTRLAEILGRTPEELRGKSLADFAHPGETARVMENLRKSLKEGEQLSRSEHRFLRRDGKGIWVGLSARCISGADAGANRIVAAITDLTERRDAQEALNRVEVNYWEIFNATNDALFVQDAYTGAILDVNKSAETVYGYTRQEILFMNVHDLSSGEPPYTLNEAVRFVRMAVEEGPQTFEWHCKRKNGELFWAEVALTSSRIGGEGRVLAVVRDIADRKEIEQKLKYLSVHDSLTGLFNRSHFEAEFKRAAKGRMYPISIIVVDMDGLKAINDTAGHEAGDRMIRTAADILRQAFRTEDLVARIGGDEFAVLLPGADVEVASTALRRISEEEELTNKRGNAIPVRLSLGSATALSSKEVDDLFNMADSRMYADKTARKLRLKDAGDGTKEGQPSFDISQLPHPER